MTVIRESGEAKGHVLWKLYDEHGALKESGEVHNLITQLGDQFVMERAYAPSGVTPPPQITGMKLGTGSTTPDKTGSPAQLTTYLTNSHQALDAGSPTSSLVSGARRITMTATFAPGKATSASPITEVVLVNESLTNATSLAAATVARALFSPSVTAKAAGDTLVVTWQHDWKGT